MKDQNGWCGVRCPPHGNRWTAQRRQKIHLRVHTSSSELAGTCERHWTGEYYIMKERLPWKKVWLWSVSWLKQNELYCGFTQKKALAVLLLGWRVCFYKRVHLRISGFHWLNMLIKTKDFVACLCGCSLMGLPGQTLHALCLPHPFREQRSVLNTQAFFKTLSHHFVVALAHSQLQRCIFRMLRKRHWCQLC